MAKKAKVGSKKPVIKKTTKPVSKSVVKSTPQKAPSKTIKPSSNAKKGHKPIKKAKPEEDIATLYEKNQTSISSEDNDHLSSNATVSKGKRKNYSEMDKEVLDYINAAGTIPILIDKIAHNLDLSFDEIKKSLVRLENKNPPKIQTRLVMEDSRWILEIRKIEEYGIDHSKKKVSKLIWDTVNDMPCFICPFSSKCSEGQELYNPKTCPYLTEWLMTTINKGDYHNNPFHPEFDVKKKRRLEFDEEVPAASGPEEEESESSDFFEE